MNINNFPTDFAKNINIINFVNEVNKKKWSGNIDIPQDNNTFIQFNTINELFDKFSYIYKKANITITLKFFDFNINLDSDYEEDLALEEESCFDYINHELILPNFFNIDNEYGNCIDIYIHEITHVIDYLLGFIIYNKPFYSINQKSDILKAIKQINISNNYFYKELEKRGFNYEDPQPVIIRKKDSYRYAAMLDIIDGFGKGYFLKEYQRIKKLETPNFHKNCIGMGHGKGYTSDEEISKEFFANFISLTFIGKEWIPIILYPKMCDHYPMYLSMISYLNTLSNDLQQI